MKRLVWHGAVTVSPVSPRLLVKMSNKIRYFFPTTGTKEKKIRQWKEEISYREKGRFHVLRNRGFSSMRESCCGSGWWEGTCQRGTVRVSRS